MRNKFTNLLPCRVTEEVHIFTKCLQGLPEICLGSLMKWSRDVILLPLLLSEAFTGLSRLTHPGHTARPVHGHGNSQNPPTKLCPRPAFDVFALMRLLAFRQQEAVTSQSL